MNRSLLVICVVSLYLSFAAFRTFLRDRKRSYVSVTGTVVEMERSEKHNKISFTPIYEYRYAGQCYRGRHKISSAKYGPGLTVVAATKYPVGSEIPLLVDEKEPGFSVVDDSTKSLNPLSALIFLVIGMICGVWAIRSI